MSTSPRGFYVASDGCAMTFEEIGQAMGITRGHAFMIYKCAMRKIRRDRTATRRLAELIAYRERMRELKNG